MASANKRRSTATPPRGGLPAPIAALFARQPGLWGFAVRGPADVPDSCARSGDEHELFVSDIGVAPSVSTRQYGEIFDEIAAAIAELLVEQPDAEAQLRGRTFVRRLQ